MWTEEHRRIYRREGNGYPSDLEKCGVVTAGAAGAWGDTRRATAQDRYAGGDERHSLPAAHRLPVALLATRWPSAALDGLQHLPQVPAGRRLGGNLGRAAHGLTGADGARGQPVGGGARQPIAQISRKRGGKDNQV